MYVTAKRKSRRKTRLINIHLPHTYDIRNNKICQYVKIIFVKKSTKSHGMHFLTQGIVNKSLIFKNENIVEAPSPLGLCRTKSPVDILVRGKGRGEGLYINRKLTTLFA